jgi:hypothetical protein
VVPKWGYNGTMRKIHKDQSIKIDRDIFRRIAVVAKTHKRSAKKQVEVFLEIGLGSWLKGAK